MREKKYVDFASPLVGETPSPQRACRVKVFRALH